MKIQIHLHYRLLDDMTSNINTVHERWKEISATNFVNILDCVGNRVQYCKISQSTASFLPLYSKRIYLVKGWKHR
jgi:RNA processing factor Prp31